MYDEAAKLGTRFRVFPQPPFVAGYEHPETISLGQPLGSLLPGPADAKIYVRDPVIAKHPYDSSHFPPFAGDVFAPPEPGPDGHYDHLDVGTRAFFAAHSYACVRRVLDIGQSYLGHPIAWHFEPTYERLEVIPWVDWDNAHSGFGYLELGTPAAEELPYAMNFGIIAHEVGHLLLLAEAGPPKSDDFAKAPPGDFLPYHEAIADTISMLSLLNFDLILDNLLRRTKGNLFVANELDRIGITSPESELRNASHSLRMSDVGYDVHDRSRPYTGAIFDSLVEIFQALLYERGLNDLDPYYVRDLRKQVRQRDLDSIIANTAADFELRHFSVKAALEEARDAVGEALFASWIWLDPENFSFRSGAEAIVRAASSGRGRRFEALISDNFAWREIL
jgi:hypothetical protein